MSLKERLLKSIGREIQKQNPWQPYRGPGGGEGWMNMVTGEVRYQDNRPEPSEGMPDDHEGGLPEGFDEEQAEQHADAETIDDWLEPGIEEWADEIDGVSEIEIEVDGETITGNPMAVDEEEGTIEVIDDETFEEYHVTPDQVETHPLQLEPELGWGDGWADPPTEPSELETGQQVELYDFDRGEWVTGEVRSIDDWGADGMYVDIYDEENEEVYEFLDGEATGHTNALITAQEDLFRPDLIEEFDPADIDIEAGDDIVVFDELDGEFIEGEVIYDGGSKIEVEAEDGTKYKVTDDNRFTPLSEEGMAEYELEQADLLEAPALLPEEPEGLAGFEDDLVEIEHPTEGPVTGEVEVIDHGEKGRHLYVGDTEVGIPLDDPEHPLANVHVESAENPYNDFTEEHIPYLDPGDELIISDGNDHWTTEVDGFSDDGSEIKLDGGWMDVDELAEGYDGAEVVMTDSDLEPNPPQGLEWHEPESYDDIFVGDEVWFDDSMTAAPQRGEVTDVKEPIGSDDPGRLEVVDPETGEEQTLSVSQVEGHAAVTGGIPDPETVPDYLNPGDGVSITYRDADGELNEIDAMVLSETDFSGEFSVRTEDGEIHRFNNQNSGENFAITEEGLDLGGEGTDRPPEEVASEVAETVGLDHHGAHILGQEEKDTLKGELMYHFDPDRVQEFYSLQSEGGSAWKSTSGSQDAADYEAAYKRALGIEAPERGEELDHLDEGYASRELQEIAETAAELSQQHFEQTYGDGTTLDRGTSPAAAHKLFADYLAAPAAEEYDSPFLAINNFSTNRHTAERFEGDGADPGATVAWETSVDDVVAMHDYLFTEEGTHESENEVTLRGDMDAIPAENVDLHASGAGDGANFGKLPEEWSNSEAHAFLEFANKAGDEISESMTWNEDVVHNTLEIRDVLEEEHGLDTSTNTFFSEAEQAAEELGVDRGAADGSADPELEFDDGFEEFDPFEWEEEELVGETIRYEDDWGEVHEGEVTFADAGMIETEIGHELFSDQINEIQSGEPSTADDFDAPEFDPEALESGHEVQWVGSDGVESGAVSYTGDSGDFIYVEDPDAAGGVATVDADDVIDVPDDVAEGTDDGASTTTDVPEPSEIDWDGVEWDEFDAADAAGANFEPGTPIEWESLGEEHRGVVTDQDGTWVTVEPTEESADVAGVSGEAEIVADEVTAVGETPDGADDGEWVEYDYHAGEMSTFDLEGETIEYYDGQYEVEEAVNAAEVQLENGETIDAAEIHAVYDEGSDESADGPDVGEWDTDLGDYVTDTAVTSATPGDTFTVSDEFVGDEMQLEVVDVEDGVPIVDPVDEEEHGWSEIPIDAHDDWTIESVQEGEPSASDSGSGTSDFDPETDADALEPGDEVTVEIGSDEFTGPITDLDLEEGFVDIDAESVDGDVPATIDEITEFEGGDGEGAEGSDADSDDPDAADLVPDLGEFSEIEPEGADDLSEHEGEWVRLEMDNFDDPVFGRLDEAMDAGPNGMVEISDAQTLGDETFPMEGYTGGVDEVTAVHDADEGDDFNDEIDDLLDDVGLGDESADGSDGASHIGPENVHDAEPGVGEEFTTNIPGEGEVDVEVTDTSVDPAYPVEVESDESGETYLIWPEGEVENA